MELPVWVVKFFLQVFESSHLRRSCQLLVTSKIRQFLRCFQSLREDLQHLWTRAYKWWHCCVWSQCWFPISTAAWLVICWAAKKCRNCSNQLVIIPPTHQKHPNTRQQPPVQVVSNMSTSFGPHSFYRSPLEFEPLAFSEKVFYQIIFFAIQLPFPIDTFGILAFLDNLLFNNSAIKAVKGFNFFEGATSSSADRSGRAGKTQYYVN